MTMLKRSARVNKYKINSLFPIFHEPAVSTIYKNVTTIFSNRDGDTFIIDAEVNDGHNDGDGG